MTIDLVSLQQEIYENKRAKGFNITDVHLEFNYLYGEIAEAVDAYLQKKEDLGEELADIMIYLLGIAQINGINLEEGLCKKVKKNKQREYKTVNGVLTRTKNV